MKKQAIIIKNKTLNVEIAKSTEEQQQGLMNRKELKQKSGMLFVYDQEQILSFWMKDTYIPLSIAFIDKKGNILQIEKLKPHDTNNVKSKNRAQYALEVNQGWFEKNNIAPGDKLDVSQINIENPRRINVKIQAKNIA